MAQINFNDPETIAGLKKIFVQFVKEEVMSDPDITQNNITAFLLVERFKSIDDKLEKLATTEDLKELGSKMATQNDISSLKSRVENIESKMATTDGLKELESKIDILIQIADSLNKRP